MRRDFSETAEQSLKDLIDQINDEQWCKWTDAIGDFFIFGLDIQNYLDNVDQYHKKILDKKKHNQRRNRKDISGCESCGCSLPLHFSNML